MLASCGKQCNFSQIGLVLDHFHKRNHTWCLKNLPQTNPDTPQNAALLQNKNTEACEQLNSWITGRTKSSLDALPFIGAPCSSSTMFGWRQRLTACGDDLPKARCSMILTRLAVGKICYAIITRDFFVLAVCSSHVSYLVIPSENRCSPCQILMHFQG